MHAQTILVRCRALAAVSIFALALSVLTNTLTAQIPVTQQFAQLGTQHLPLASGSTNAAAFGDIDGDGDLDLILGVSDRWSQAAQNRVYINDGIGRYRDETATRLPVAMHATYCLVVGDVDGDGDLDIFFGNSNAGAQATQLYLNNGAGVFQDVSSTHLPPHAGYTAAMALGDLDGDGDLDLVASTPGTSTPGTSNRLFRNDGTGTFRDVTHTCMPSIGNATAAIALGDTDGDGDLDMLLGNGLGWWGSDRLYENDGTGCFRDISGTHFPVNGMKTTDVALVDIDADGDLDAVVAEGGQPTLYENNSSGRFHIRTATSFPQAPQTGVIYVAAADLDGDGDLDLMFGGGPRASLMHNNGAGVFTEASATHLPGAAPSGQVVALGDSTGNGHIDCFLANLTADTMLHNDGTGVFRNATAPAIPEFPHVSPRATFGDLDGDGDEDLIVAVFGQQDRSYHNNGDGTFEDVTAATMPIDSNLTSSITLGDIDGDGDLDQFVATGYSGLSNWLRFNNGSGVFTAVSLGPSSSPATASALADVDADGDLDLFLSTTAQPRLLSNDGAGSFTDVTTSNMPVIWTGSRALAAADLDGDGDVDVITGHTQDHLFLNNGAGVFADATASHLPASATWTHALALGDVDNDGDLDLVLGNGGTTGEQNELYLNDGNGVFTSVTATQLPAAIDHTVAVQLLDMDGDGDLDLVVGNSWPNLQPAATGQNRLYANDGQGTFVDASSALPAGATATIHVAAADIDRDGDIDLIESKAYQTTVLVNLQRQLHAPYDLQSGTPYVLHGYGHGALGGLVTTYLSSQRVHVALPPLGTAMITPQTSLGVAPIPTATGSATFVWNVPNSASLVGIEVHAQAAVISPAGTVRLSNAISKTIVP